MKSISSRQVAADTPLLRVPKSHRKPWREFMTEQMDLPESDQRWGGMCESLQRQAHGFEAAFASAFAHMIATPMSERIHPLDAPVSSFIFVDDPNDSNKFGHVVGKWAHDSVLENIPVVTNDVTDGETGYDPGNVTIVPLGWFPRHWGDAIQFATTWFGGTEIPTFTPGEAQRGTEAWVLKAIERAQAVVRLMNKALTENDEAKHPRHERAILREIEDQKQIIEDLKSLLPA